MSVTEFERDPLGYAARYPFWIDETNIKTLQPATARDHHQMLDADDFQLYYSVGSFMNARVFTIHRNQPPGERRLYFLPYVKNAATSMKLGEDCDFFLTSSLSGCTVQVFGSRSGPTVTHANAAQVFTDAFADEKDRLQRGGMDDIESGETADRNATRDVNTRIDRMLPSPGRRTPVLLRKNHYLSHYNSKNFKKVKKDYLEEHKGEVQRGFRLYDVNPEREAGRPKIGATVFGLRNFNGARGWTIYYQTTLTIQPRGKKSSGFLNMGTKKDNFASDEIALGGVHQLFPAP